MNNQTNTALSMSGKKWNILQADEFNTEHLSQNLGISVNLAKLLSLRGHTIHTAPMFLAPTLKNLMPNPSILKDMDKASLRIAEAIINKQKIGIIGDYDVDGATSTSVMRLFLNSVGAETITHIPEREEGYGPSTIAFDKFRKNNVKLVITVDCGTTAFDILDKEAPNFDIIIIDHHEAEAKLPKVHSVVNPKRLDQDDNRKDLSYMAAVGVVFLTVIAINRCLREKGYAKALAQNTPLKWLDLVALGTVCDVVPLVGLNRAYVSQGLKIMADRQNLGLTTLFDNKKSSKPIFEKPDAYHLGFVLGPRINACGRVGKASIASQLLCSSNSHEAEQLVDEMNSYNEDRKKIEDYVLVQSKEIIESTPQNYPMTFVYNTNWHQGVIGIVAGKLKEHYNLPSFVMSIEEDEVKGSARSIPGVDLGALIISAKEKGVITKGGGHTMAAGFSLTEAQIPLFREFVGEYIKKSLNNVIPTPILDIDLSLSLNAANENLCKEIEQLKPFGTSNSEPLIMLKNIFIDNVFPLGSNHLRCNLKDQTGKSLSAVAFNVKDDIKSILTGKNNSCFDIVGNLRFNNWNNKTTLQFTIIDIKRT